MIWLTNITGRQLSFPAARLSSLDLEAISLGSLWARFIISLFTGSSYLKKASYIVADIVANVSDIIIRK